MAVHRRRRVGIEHHRAAAPQVHAQQGALPLVHIGGAEGKHPLHGAAVGQVHPADPLAADRHQSREGLALLQLQMPQVAQRRPEVAGHQFADPPQISPIPAVNGHGHGPPEQPGRPPFHLIGNPLDVVNSQLHFRRHQLAFLHRGDPRPQKPGTLHLQLAVGLPPSHRPEPEGHVHLLADPQQLLQEVQTGLPRPLDHFVAGHIAFRQLNIPGILPGLINLPPPAGAHAAHAGLQQLGQPFPGQPLAVEPRLHQQGVHFHGLALGADHIPAAVHYPSALLLQGREIVQKGVADAVDPAGPHPVRPLPQQALPHLRIVRAVLPHQHLHRILQGVDKPGPAVGYMSAAAVGAGHLPDRPAAAAQVFHGFAVNTAHSAELGHGRSRALPALGPGPQSRPTPGSRNRRRRTFRRRTGSRLKTLINGAPAGPAAAAGTTLRHPRRLRRSGRRPLFSRQPESHKEYSTFFPADRLYPPVSPLKS